MTPRQIGVLTVLVASCLWAIESVIVKFAFRTAGYLETSAFRNLGVAVVGLAYAYAATRGESRHRLLRMRPKEWSALVYIATAGTVGADLLYYYALQTIPILNALLIAHLQPIFIILIGFLVLREEKLGWSDYLGISIMIASGLLVVTRTFDNLAHVRLGTRGDLLMLVATVLWATASIAMRKYVRHIHAGTLTFYRFLIAGLIVYGFAVCRATHASHTLLLPFPTNIQQPILGLVVGAGVVLYYESMKRMKAAQVSALELSTPFFAAVLGYIVLKEGTTPLQVAGLALLVLGVYLISRKEHAE
jgi:drug/metabolite transporter (DMT)-like permease